MMTPAELAARATKILEALEADGWSPGPSVQLVGQLVIASMLDEGSRDLLGALRALDQRLDTIADRIAALERSL